MTPDRIERDALIEAPVQRVWQRFADHRQGWSQELDDLVQHARKVVV